MKFQFTLDDNDSPYGTATQCDIDLERPVSGTYKGFSVKLGRTPSS